MGLRQREWARATRDKLRIELGRCCKKCGTRRKLEFDVVIPVGNDKHHRRMDWSARMSFYRKQHGLGNLQLLCKSCNGLKSNRLELSNIVPPECPF